ncbi:hypothetical protein FRACYDRAFT_254199 [Fragilariopsis cylindrus CCMP1102]|uniref:Ribosome assembly protein 3 n=1 Tax=Fragilariopsis cylindrus CCMP1102 TaxID=635003 RepID=A0A1E7EL84_9STRA|nr:hypothetical protein FRACYDRAFT_254199 [Fragilariopsis cylindrus CCMP1102]|eukprot:OEU06646.1 hypothetical protein FRACYDRAFT_254199 [Fragilariopsis cylindrus CCMP1102]
MSMSIDNKEDDTTSSSCHHHLERLNNASKNAIQIVNRFATVEPPSATDHDDNDNIKNGNENDNNNPWRNPKLIEKELNIVRNELNEAWMELRKNQNNKGSSLENGDDADDDEEMVLSDTEFRVQYMDMITDAFGDILDEMNKKQEESNINSDDTNFDVEILVDCLQSGIDFLDPITEYKRPSYFNSLVLPLDIDNDTTMNDDDENKNKNNNEQQLTIHQMKQRSLGYLTC